MGTVQQVKGTEEPLSLTAAEETVQCDLSGAGDICLAKPDSSGAQSVQVNPMS